MPTVVALIYTEGMKRALVWVLLLGCGSADSGAHAPLAPPGRPTASLAPVAPPTPIAPAINVVQLPADLNAPTLAACVYTSDFPGTIPLRLAASGAPFASLTQSPSLRLTVPVGNLAEGVWVESDIGPAILHGRVSDSGFGLYPQAATVVKGFLIPNDVTPVKAIKADTDAITFAPTFEPVAMAPVDKDLSESRPCAFFALKPKAFAALRATGNETRGPVVLRPGKHEIRKELNGGVMATLTVAEEPPLADWLANSGNQKRIAWDIGGTVVFGWVSSRAVVESQALPSNRKIFVVNPLPNPGVPTWNRVKCNEDIPLVGEVGTERAVVGMIKKERFFQIGPDLNGWRGVAFPDSPVREGDKGRLVVPSMKTVGCAG